MQRWQAPEFTEIEMNAEIGAYQRDPEQAPLPARQPPPAPEAPRAAPASHAQAPAQRG